MLLMNILVAYNNEQHLSLYIEAMPEDDSLTVEMAKIAKKNAKMQFIYKFYAHKE